VLADVIQEQVDAMEEGADGQAQQQLDYDTLHTRTPMLHHAITETLRMHPPLVFLMRKVKAERRYGRHTIPAGTILASSPAAAGRSASMFVNPNVWNPRRWTDLDPDEARKRMQFTAFGGGRHQCMGRRFAYLQLATVWSVLLRRFVLKREVPLPPVDETAMVIGPKGTLPTTLSELTYVELIEIVAHYLRALSLLPSLHWQERQRYRLFASNQGKASVRRGVSSID
jgi:sterol 14-demethylase